MEVLNLATKLADARGRLGPVSVVGVQKIDFDRDELGILLNGLRALLDEEPQAPEDLSIKILRQRREVRTMARAASLSKQE